MTGIREKEFAAMPHGGRSTKDRTAAATPTPTEVRAAREAAGHDSKQAAATVYSTAKAWEDWESEAGSRRMHPAFMELYLLKTGQKTLDQVLDEAAQRKVREGEK